MQNVLVAARRDVDEKRLAKKHRDRPKEFEDYKIEWNVEGCMEPEVFKFV